MPETTTNLGCDSRPEAETTAESGSESRKEAETTADPGSDSPPELRPQQTQVLTHGQSQRPR